MAGRIREFSRCLFCILPGHFDIHSYSVKAGFQAVPKPSPVDALAYANQVSLGLDTEYFTVLKQHTIRPVREIFLLNLPIFLL